MYKWVEAHAKAAKTESPKNLFGSVFDIGEFYAMERGEISAEMFSYGILKRLSLPRTEEMVKSFLDAYIPIFSPLPCMPEILVSVSERYPVYVLSNTSHVHWRWATSEFPFLSRLDGRVLSYEVGRMKPHREMYLALFSLTGLPPEDHIFFDDLPENVEGALALGMRGYLFCGPEECVKTLKKEGIEMNDVKYVKC